MKTKFLIGIIFFFFFAAIGSAHPPQSIDLSYDQANKVLAIEARHVSQNLEKHYIRKVVITLNDKEPEVVYLHRQNSPTTFELNYNIDASVGDVISVELFCSQGGTLSKSITIEKEADDQAEE